MATKVKIAGIYIIKNLLNGKFYIGSSTYYISLAAADQSMYRGYKVQYG